MKWWLAGGVGLLLSAVEVVAPPPKAWWEAVSLSAILAIIAAVTFSIVQIMTANRAGRTESAVKAAVPVLGQKIDNVTTLVDPRLLQEIADIKRMFADETGRRHDRDVAEVAQVKADDQQAKVEAVKADTTTAATAKRDVADAAEKKT